MNDEKDFDGVRAQRRQGRPFGATGANISTPEEKDIYIGKAVRRWHSKKLQLSTVDVKRRCNEIRLETEAVPVAKLPRNVITRGNSQVSPNHECIFKI